jgi:Uma2 family endonuclease
MTAAFKSVVQARPTMLRSDVMEPRDHTESDALRKLTYDDFLCFPDDGLRHELIDGKHYVSPSPETNHQRIVRNLLTSLHVHLQDSRRGEVFVAPFDVVISNHDVVEPDVMVVLAEQSAIVTAEHVRGMPAIVVEVLSPTTRRRDETIKRALYLRAGVREYWIVDPEARTIAVWAGGAAGASTIAGGEMTSTLLPGWSMPFEILFPTRAQ